MLKRLAARCLSTTSTSHQRLLIPWFHIQHRVPEQRKSEVERSWSSLHCAVKCQTLNYSTQSELAPPSLDTQPTEPDVLYSQVHVEVMAHDPSVLNSYEFFATEAAKLLNIPCQSETPPKIIDKRTLLKSRHVHGKYHKVQYEMRTHFKLIKLSRLTGSTADTYLEYIQRNLPEGMAMKVSKTRIEALPEHIKRPEPAKGGETSPEVS
ncbi:small ribosomal subunit protein uS10m-like [Watersipora subatra]|uniref:small ribosomal subunit protein uS10m-like n=1 Tax=Watersipora subatra TaxID=2589382 RepID=UPI00355B7BEC